MFWVDNGTQAAVKSCIIQEYETDFCKIKNVGLALSHGNTRIYKLEFKLGLQALNPKLIMIHAWEQVKWNRILSLKNNSITKYIAVYPL